ncbi:hypothetical protein SHIRM173S_09407 [Streptomyces hirsutus]
MRRTRGGRRTGARAPCRRGVRRGARRTGRSGGRTRVRPPPAQRPAPDSGRHRDGGRTRPGGRAGTGTPTRPRPGLRDRLECRGHRRAVCRLRRRPHPGRPSWSGTGRPAVRTSPRWRRRTGGSTDDGGLCAGRPGGRGAGHASGGDGRRRGLGRVGGRGTRTVRGGGQSAGGTGRPAGHRHRSPLAGLRRPAARPARRVGPVRRVRPVRLRLVSFAGAPSSSTARSRTAPRLCSGSLPFPHLGDWMQDGQPASHSQEAMACRVAVSQSPAVRKARSAKPAPPG